MEVHHHPDLHHKRKNFKEYFLEFVMIFFAVTMGFFAESLREYFGDRQKETEYMHSLAEDLKEDTATLHYSIRRLQHDIDNGHELMVLFAKNELSSQNYRRILNLTIGHSVDIIFNDRTSSQLKSSGSIRLIRHRNISDSLSQYWNNEIEIMQAHDKFENFREKQHDIGFKTFSWYRVFFSPQLMGADSSIIKTMTFKAIINPGNMDEFMNASGNLFNEATYQYEPSLEKQLALGTWLIEKIHKEYPSK
jgi:hypothetical protein